MAATASRMRQLGTALPHFSLPDTVSGQQVASDELARGPLVIAFLCNHCPYVLHIQSELTAFGSWCAARNVQLLAISSNDAASYPQDGPEAMTKEALRAGYTFPYLYDESQEVAKDFGATCTPDFFVFDKSRRLAYRGQFDDSRPGNEKPVTGSDIRAAVEALLAGQEPSPQQKPSIGCGLKWKPGNAPSASMPSPLR